MKRFIASMAAVISAFSVLAFAACSSDPDTTDPDNTEPVTEVTVTAVGISGETTVYCGYDITLTASVTTSDGSAYSGTVVWASSNESVATVLNGTVTGVAEGTADITATAGGVTSSAYTVTVAGERPSDVVDAAGWVAAMTSSDIYNSMATGVENYLITRNYNTGETETETRVYNGVNYYDLTSADDGVTGYALCATTGNIDDGSDVTETSSQYYYILEPTFMRCYNAETNKGWIYDGIYTSIMSMYVQLEFDESYYGGDYFNYDDEAGAYVWEYSSGYSTYRYEIVIIDGNVSSMTMYRNTYREYDSYTYTLTYSTVINYTYGGVTVDIPEDIKTQLEALTVE